VDMSNGYDKDNAPFDIKKATDYEFECIAKGINKFITDFFDPKHKKADANTQMMKDMETLGCTLSPDALKNALIYYTAAYRKCPKVLKKLQAALEGEYGGFPKSTWIRLESNQEAEYGASFVEYFLTPFREELAKQNYVRISYVEGGSGSMQWSWKPILRNLAVNLWRLIEDAQNMTRVPTQMALIKFLGTARKTMKPDHPLNQGDEYAIVSEQIEKEAAGANAVVDENEKFEDMPLPQEVWITTNRGKEWKKYTDNLDLIDGKIEISSTGVKNIMKKNKFMHRFREGLNKPDAQCGDYTLYEHNGTQYMAKNETTRRRLSPVILKLIEEIETLRV